MNIPYIMKRCTCCGEWKVASTINFHRSKNGKYRLQSQCKDCRNKKNNQYCRDNKEKRTEQQKRYYENNREKVLERSKQYRDANKEKEVERHKRWHDKYGKQYYENNKEKLCERQKQYYQDNRDKRREHNKQYRQSPQGQVVAFNNRQRRRTKEEQQGDGITKDQWLELMSFFDWKCAYSGEYLGGNDNSFNRTIDHIVPLDAGGDNMIWNCVPMLRSLNSSKHTKDMLEWYKEQDCYDPKRLAKIYEWQEYARKKWKK